MAIAIESLDPRNLQAERKNIPMDKIRVSRDTQARVRLNPATVQEYVELLERKVEFKDDIEVYHDGFVFWVGDGFHRHAAYEKVGRLRVPALVREGSQRQAMIHAAGANAEHGLPRKREDVQRAIRMLLDDDETGRLSARTIAKLVRCSPGMVDNMKKLLGRGGEKVVYTDRHGIETEMDVSGQKERPRKTLAFGAPVNTYHDLPAGVRGVLKDVLREISQLPKESYSFVLSWLQGHLPPKPKEAGNLLTQLELEEQAEPDGLDRLGPVDEPMEEDR
jgi:hypothetical protein